MSASARTPLGGRGAFLAARGAGIKATDDDSRASIDALMRWLIEHDDMSREVAQAVVSDRLIAALNTPQRES